MKKKIIIITLVSSMLSILIYFYTKKEEINIVAIGDAISLGMTPYNIKGYSFNDYLKEKYNSNRELHSYYEYASVGKTVKELTYEIKENKSLIINDKKQGIQQIINNANILTITIGMDELSEDKITLDIIKDYLKDMEELLKLIKSLNNKKVIVTGLYTIKKKELLSINKINTSLRELCSSYNFIFIDISTILTDNNYYFEPNNYYLNYLGNKAIYSEIIKKL